MIDTHELTVYIGHNNPTKKTVLDSDGTGVEFLSLATSKISVFVGGVELSSNNGHLTFNNEGEITFTLGSAKIRKGKYVSRLVMYTPMYPLGFPLFSEETDVQLHINVV